MADLRYVDPALSGERMVRPGDEDELIFIQRAAPDTRVAELSDDPEFDLAAELR